jgi:uncharacterized iron-regulated membrane protein
MAARRDVLLRVPLDAQGLRQHGGNGNAPCSRRPVAWVDIVKGGLRASMAWLHNWVGIVTGWVLYAIALSGALSVFRPEISVWMHPELAGRTAQAVPATAAAIGWLQAHAPDSPAWYLSAAGPRAPYTWALWLQDGHYVQRALDPVTGAPDGIRDTLGGEFFYRFHFQLQLPYPWGRLLAAIAAMVLVLTLLTGIVVHRRIFSDFFTFRPRKGQRSWLDAHNLMGVAALPFHLMIAFTGAVTLGTLLFPWGIGAAYHHAPAAFDTDMSPATVARPASAHPGTLAPVDAMLRMADQRLGRAGLGEVYVFNPKDAASSIVVTGANGDRIGHATHVLQIDGTNGRVLKEDREDRPIMATFAVLYGLHIARFAPGPTRWLYFASGVLLACVIASGLRLWTIRRRRQGRTRGLVAMERLNAGMIAGTPLAFSAYFLANRVLPVSMPGRADHEVQAVFIVWGATLVLAVLTPAVWSWRILCGAAVVALGAIVVLSAPWTTGVEQGTAIVAAALALGFAFAISRTRRGGMSRGRQIAVSR